MRPSLGFPRPTAGRRGPGTATLGTPELPLPCWEHRQTHVCSHLGGYRTMPQANAPAACRGQPDPGGSGEGRPCPSPPVEGAQNQLPGVAGARGCHLASLLLPSTIWSRETWDRGYPPPKEGPPVSCRPAASVLTVHRVEGGRMGLCCMEMQPGVPERTAAHPGHWQESHAGRNLVQTHPLTVGWVPFDPEFTLTPFHPTLPS